MLGLIRRITASIKFVHNVKKTSGYFKPPFKCNGGLLQSEVLSFHAVRLRTGTHLGDSSIGRDESVARAKEAREQRLREERAKNSEDAIYSDEPILYHVITLIYAILLLVAALFGVVCVTCVAWLVL